MSKITACNEQREQRPERKPRPAAQSCVAAFADIEALSRACRYSDCTHNGEPGCAVRKALEDGTLDRARWNSYLKLKTENEYAADSTGYLEAKRARFKDIARINKANKKAGR